LIRNHADTTSRSGILRREFRSVPAKFIDDTLKQHRFLWHAYLALDAAQTAHDEMPIKPFAKLKKMRPGSRGEEPFDMGKVSRELLAVRGKARKNQELRDKKKKDEEDDAAADRLAFETGDVRECGCCFSDTPVAKTIHCNGDKYHYFCRDCLKGHITAQLELQKHVVTCMDGSGCNAEFSRNAKKSCLDDQTFERLERVQQQNELREAMLPGLENCPFCDFAAICPPIEEDKEFRCHSLDCGLTSCRLCKAKTHLPKTCEENRKEQGVYERHLIEEKMTQALVRECPNCKVQIVKEGGCNKILCARCKTCICDVCGKDITKEKYDHFKVSGPGRNGCWQYDVGDEGRGREIERVKAAEQAARAKVLEDNPGITEDDLKFKMSEASAKGKPAENVDMQQRVRNMQQLQHRILRYQPAMLRPPANYPDANVGLPFNNDFRAQQYLPPAIPYQFFPPNNDPLGFGPPFPGGHVRRNAAFNPNLIDHGQALGNRQWQQAFQPEFGMEEYDMANMAQNAAQAQELEMLRRDVMDRHRRRNGDHLP
jgi:E3 ubiquitin-protein ligase RNF216